MEKERPDRCERADQLNTLGLELTLLLSSCLLSSSPLLCYFLPRFSVLICSPPPPKSLFDSVHTHLSSLALSLLAYCDSHFAQLPVSNGLNNSRLQRQCSSNSVLKSPSALVDICLTKMSHSDDRIFIGYPSHQVSLSRIHHKE